MADTLEKVEAYAKAEVPNYVPVPDALKLDSTTVKGWIESSLNAGNIKGLKDCFVESLRINPVLTYDIYVRRFLEKTPKKEDNSEKTSALSLELSIPRKALATPPFGDGIDYDTTVRKLSPGEKISPFEILVTAADEPDYGTDMGLWTGASSFGKTADQQKTTDSYNFGPQAFSISTDPITSQGPFHTGFFYENWLVNKLAAAGTQHSYVEYRIKQFVELSKFAFETKHEYWGWHFLGWGLHYIQDLCQPYHSSLIPGENLANVAFSFFLGLLKCSALENKIITRLANAHFGFELYSYGLLDFGLSLNQGVSKEKKEEETKKVSSPAGSIPLPLSLKKCGCCSHSQSKQSVFIQGERQEIETACEILLPALENYPGAEDSRVYSDSYPRHVISAAAFALGKPLATALNKALPSAFLEKSEEWYVLDEAKLNIKIFNAVNPILFSVFENVRNFSRLFVKTAVKEG